MEVKQGAKRLIKAAVEDGQRQQRTVPLSSSVLVVPSRVHVEIIYAYELPDSVDRQLVSKQLEGCLRLISAGSDAIPSCKSWSRGAHSCQIDSSVLKSAGFQYRGIHYLTLTLLKCSSLGLDVETSPWASPDIIKSQTGMELACSFLSQQAQSSVGDLTKKPLSFGAIRFCHQTSVRGVGFSNRCTSPTSDGVHLVLLDHLLFLEKYAFEI
ncbi:hypothetical protein R1sor_020554 [Riccia sorocarpa]|uniref:Uncharacterized protein n=1 Tax=Riccia sorocarpa TaxID=122646 RepID=A0ABD3IIH2_9MARC